MYFMTYLIHYFYTFKLGATAKSDFRFRISNEKYTKRDVFENVIKLEHYQNNKN